MTLCSKRVYYYLNPIDPKKSFTIIQNGGKYLFTVPDILNLTMTGLTNSHDFFAEPRFPRNPYTNIRFTKTDMYNIYFKVIETRFITPPLLIECFLNHFELDNFLIDNESKLRNISIKNYVMSSPHTMLYSEIMYMIRKYFKGRRVIERRIKTTKSTKYKTVRSTIQIAIDVHADFPRNVLVDIMRPYLYLYLLIHDHIRGTEKNTIARMLFDHVVQRFLKYNHSFGRRQICASFEINGNPFSAGSQHRVLKYCFNDKHEIFTVQQADEMFNSKILLQKNDELSVVTESTIDDGYDDDDQDYVDENSAGEVPERSSDLSVQENRPNRPPSLWSADENSLVLSQHSFVTDPPSYSENNHIGLAVIYNDWNYIPPFDITEYVEENYGVGGVVNSDTIFSQHDPGSSDTINVSYENSQLRVEEEDSVLFLSYNSENESTGYDSN